MRTGEKHLRLELGNQAEHIDCGTQRDIMVYFYVETKKLKINKIIIKQTGRVSVEFPMYGSVMQY
jgi:hypothetical protein